MQDRRIRMILPCGHEVDQVGDVTCCGRLFRPKIIFKEIKPEKKFRTGAYGTQAGVRFRAKRWEAYIGRTYLGRYSLRAEAIKARKAAEDAA